MKCGRKGEEGCFSWTLNMMKTALPDFQGVVHIEWRKDFRALIQQRNLIEAPGAENLKDFSAPEIRQRLRMAVTVEKIEDDFQRF